MKSCCLLLFLLLFVSKITLAETSNSVSFEFWPTDASSPVLDSFVLKLLGRQDLCVQLARTSYLRVTQNEVIQNLLGQIRAQSPAELILSLEQTSFGRYQASLGFTRELSEAGIQSPLLDRRSRLNNCPIFSTRAVETYLTEVLQILAIRNVASANEIDNKLLYPRHKCPGHK